MPTDQKETAPFVDSRWSINLEMRIESGTGATRSDYEFEVSLDGYSIDRNTPRQAAPDGGEALVGKFTVEQRRFGVDSGGSHPQPTADGWSRSGTITIYGSDGRIATTSFELTYTGSTGAVGLTPSRSPLNWTRPSN